jgi:hypothetical protein
MLQSFMKLGSGTQIYIYVCVCVCVGGGGDYIQKYDMVIS